MNDIRATEEKVLSVLVTTGAGWGMVGHVLRPADFSDPDAAALFAAIGACVQAGQPYDYGELPVTHPAVVDYAAHLAASVPASAKHLHQYARTVADAAASRRLRLAAGRIANTEGVTHDEAMRAIGACAPPTYGKRVPLDAAAREVLAQVQARMDTDDPPGVLSDLPGLDAITGGFRPASLVVLAARPSVGKTAVVSQIAFHAARRGHPALFFTLEMPARDIAKRLLAHATQVGMGYFDHPRTASDDDHHKVFEAVASMAGLPLELVDSGQTVESLAALAREAHAARPLGLIVVDYLTLMTHPKAATTNDAVQLMTRALKRLAVELNVPVLLLSQLNRAAVQEVPTLAHLRDSGSIEQDADVVILLHEIEGHGVVLNVAKNRNGPKGRIGLSMDMEHMTVEAVPVEDIDPPRVPLSFGGPPKGATAAAYRAAKDGQ